MATNINLKSGVWAHFIRNPVSQTVECKLCKAKLKSTGGSIKSITMNEFVFRYIELYRYPGLTGAVNPGFERTAWVCQR